MKPSFLFLLVVFLIFAVSVLNAHANSEPIMNGECDALCCLKDSRFKHILREIIALKDTNRKGITVQDTNTLGEVFTVSRFE